MFHQFWFKKKTYFYHISSYLASYGSRVIRFIWEWKMRKWYLKYICFPWIKFSLHQHQNILAPLLSVVLTKVTVGPSPLSMLLDKSSTQDKKGLNRIKGGWRSIAKYNRVLFSSFLYRWSLFMRMLMLMSYSYFALYHYCTAVTIIIHNTTLWLARVFILWGLWLSFP